MFTLNDVMTIPEASERWGISNDTIHSRIRTIAKDDAKFQAAFEAGLIKKSHGAWLITSSLMKMWFGSEVKTKDNE